MIPLPDSPLLTDARQTALLDTSKRAASGIFVYFVLWVAISLVTGLYNLYPGWVIGNAAVLLLNALTRTWLHRRLPLMVETRFRLAHNLFVVLTLANALQWGLLTAIGIAQDPMRATEIPMLLASCGIAAGGTTALAINPIILYLFPTSVLLPAGIALLMDRSPEHTLIAVLAAIFTLYIARSSRVVHTDYWNALGNRRLLEERARELERISVTDALTQLRNRLFFDAQFELEWKRAFRQRTALTILLLDLDHFKQVNDSYGHAFGDLCLQEVAKVLAHEVSRSGDVLARYGGEEFIVMLSNTAEDGASVVAERLLQSVRAIDLKFGGERVPVTCSIGIASGIPVAADRGFRLINEADKALYRAKQGGRDRIVVASASMIDTLTFTAARVARDA